MRENVNEMVSRATFSTYARLRITETNFSRHLSSIYIKYNHEELQQNDHFTSNNIIA